MTSCSDTDFRETDITAAIPIDRDDSQSKFQSSCLESGAIKVGE